MKNTLRKSLISFFSLWGSVIIILFVIVLSGCSTTKKVEKTKSDIAINSDLESKKKTDETTNVKTAASGETASSKNTQTSENQSKETETKTTKYDPSKPIVPGTGKPPVIEETTTKEKTLSQKDNKILEETRTKNNLLIEENKRLKQSNDSLLSVKAKESSKSENKETTSFPWWKQFFVLLVLFSLYELFFFIVKKIGLYSIIQTFFRKLFIVKKES